MCSTPPDATATCRAVAVTLRENTKMRKLLARYAEQPSTAANADTVKRTVKLGV